MIATHCMVQSYLKLDQGHAFHLVLCCSIHFSMIHLGIEKIQLREKCRYCVVLYCLPAMKAFQPLILL